MTLLVDTSVWSLAFRRDVPARTAEVQALADALDGGDVVVTTGLILQEILQGFGGPKAASGIIERFRALAFVMPELGDYIAAAELRNACRRKGVQLGTVDALIARLCISNELTLLTADRDFMHAAKHCPLRVWTAQARSKRDA
jgi:predicted nucleic acid-binding protein